MLLKQPSGAFFDYLRGAPQSFRNFHEGGALETEEKGTNLLLLRIIWQEVISVTLRLGNKMQTTYPQLLRHNLLIDLLTLLVAR